ncbi:MAG: DUF3343 domain-containing protein [Calditrichales bacterium]|nr:DUF3343 domain-containing protein [Calditrichales bacterium]
MPLFKRKKDTSFDGEGLLLFAQVPDAMKAEKILKNSGYIIKLVAPPPALRKGCDLALQINLVEQPGIERTLKEKDAEYIEITPLKNENQEILGIVKITDFDNAVMIKAGNMKLTFDRKSGVILNISGGGCPDIPYLYTELIDKKITEAPRPKDIGFTLCALMLERALDESLEIWEGRK